MRIILSPTRKMNRNTDSLEPTGLPVFIEYTEKIKAALQSLSDAGLQALWGCNDSIAKQNVQRVRSMNLYGDLTPAILSYEGIAYQYMAPAVFENSHFVYIQEHLRILSGFYGLLRPFDGIVPYRLEMQTKLAVDGCGDLYEFWGGRLAQQLACETDFVLNLASKEYSKAVKPYLRDKVFFLTCTFGELKDGKVMEKGTLCKMARGHMVRWLAEHHVTGKEDIRQFDRMGYRFAKDWSGDDHYVFLKSPDAK